MKEGEYEPSDYLPVSEKDIPKMYQELLAYIKSMGNPWLKKLAESFFPGWGIRKKISIPFRSQKRTSRLCRRTAGAFAQRDKTMRFLLHSVSDAEPGSDAVRRNVP